MAKLILENKNVSYPLSDNIITIGRSSKCTININDSQSSRIHCKIIKHKDLYYLTDVNSHNGTYLNERVVKKSLLNNGDKISVGKSRFVFLLEDIEKKAEKQENRQTLIIIKNPKQKIRKIKLDQKGYTIGRKDINDISIKDVQISARHAKITYQKNGWWIHDLKSRNGIFVNSKKVESCLLKHEDSIKLGESICIFKSSYSSGGSYLFQKSNSVKWVIFLLIFLVLFSWVVINREFLYEDGAIVTSHNNLIDDFSYEEGLSWKCKGKMQIQTTLPRSGKSSLYYSSDSKTSLYSYHESEYWTPIKLSYSKVYRINAWVKYNKLAGVAGIKILWFDKKNQILQDYSPLFNGSSDKWRKIDFIAYPPPMAENFHIFCFVVGKADFVSFDDISVVEIKKEKLDRVEKPNLEQNGVKIYLNSQGVCHLYYEFKHLLDFGKIRIWDNSGSQKKLIGSQEFASVKTEVFDDKLVGSGTIYNLTGGDNFPIKVICKRANNSIELDYQIKNNNYYLEYTFTTYRKYLDKEFLANLLKDYSKKKIINQCILNFENIGRKIGFFHKKNIKYTLKKEGHKLYFNYPLPNNKFYFKIKTDFTYEEKKLKEWKSLSQKYEEQGLLGKASVYYNKILEELSFYPVSKLAERRLHSFYKEFMDDFIKLNKSSEQARLFNSIDYYDKVITESQQLLKKWEDFPRVKQIQNIQKKLELEKLYLNSVQKKNRYDQLLKIAQNLEKRKYWKLSLEAYRKIEKQFPVIQDKKFISDKINFLQQK